MKGYPARKEFFKWLLFPGINLHARLRYRILPRYFGSAARGGARLVLDAGCGNGMLSYRSYLLGNRVVGVSIKDAEVAACKRLFNQYLGISEERLSFRVCNLYDAEGMGDVFDEVICSEVLEHLSRDADVCRSFWNLLKPGGVLHLCCPNAEHPDNAAKELDGQESGGHVRPGYTLESYAKLLEPIGFKSEEHLGLGGPIRQAFNRRIIRTEERFGFTPAFAMFLLALPCLPFDSVRPRVPYSLYIRASKGCRIDPSSQ